MSSGNWKVNNQRIREFDCKITTYTVPVTHYNPLWLRHSEKPWEEVDLPFFVGCSSQNKIPCTPEERWWGPTVKQYGELSALRGQVENCGQEILTQIRIQVFQKQIREQCVGITFKSRLVWCWNRTIMVWQPCCYWVAHIGHNGKAEK